MTPLMLGSSEICIVLLNRHVHYKKCHVEWNYVWFKVFLGQVIWTIRSWSLGSVSVTSTKVIRELGSNRSLWCLGIVLLVLNMCIIKSDMLNKIIFGSKCSFILLPSFKSKISNVFLPAKFFAFLNGVKRHYRIDTD